MRTHDKRATMNGQRQKDWAQQNKDREGAMGTRSYKYNDAAQARRAEEAS